MREIGAVHDEQGAIVVCYAPLDFEATDHNYGAIVDKCRALVDGRVTEEQNG